MPQRNSLSKGAEARLGKTYLAKNKKFIMFHMSMSSREVRDLVGSPRASQAEQTWVLCAIAMPCPMSHAHSFLPEQKNRSSRSEGGLGLCWFACFYSSTPPCCAEERFHGSWGPVGGHEQLGEQRKLPQKMKGIEEMAVGTHMYTDTHT